MDSNELKNYTFITDTFEKLGFNDAFNKTLLDGMQKGLSEIQFGIARIKDRHDSKEELQVSPKVVEHSEKPGFYILTHYDATFKREGQEPVSQPISVFQMTGLNVEKARNLLDGGSVLNTVYEKKVPRTRWTQIDFNSPKLENGSFKQVNTPESEFNLVKTLSLLPRITSDKEDIVSRLQKGEKVPVTIKHIDGSTERVTIDVDARKKTINLLDSKSLSIPFTAAPAKVFEMLPPSKLQEEKQDGKEMSDLAKKALKGGEPQMEGGKKKKVS